MIDISGIVVERVTDAIHAVDRSALVREGLIEDPTSIPCTFIREMDNYTHTKSMTRRGETHATLAYEVNTFGAVDSAKEVQAAIDTEMQSMGFVRKFCKVIPNADNTLCRIVARYGITVSVGKQDGNDTVYMTYRKS